MNAKRRRLMQVLETLEMMEELEEAIRVCAREHTAAAVVSHAEDTTARDRTPSCKQASITARVPRTLAFMIRAS